MKSLLTRTFLIIFSITAFAQKPEVVITTGHAEFLSAIAYNPSGSLIASGSLDKTIKIWDVSSNMEIRTLGGNDGRISMIRFHPTKDLLLSKDDDYQVKLWDLKTGKEIWKVKGYSYSKEAVFCDNGTTIGYVGDDYFYHVVDYKTKTEVRKFPLGLVMRCGVSPDGKKVIVLDVKKTLHIFDANSGNEVATIPSEQVPMTDLVVSPNGRFLAIGFTDQVIRIYDLNAKSEYAKVKSHSNVLIDLAFTNDSKTLVSLSHDRTIKGYDLKSKKEVFSTPTDIMGAQCLGIHPKEGVFATGSDYKIKVYNANSGNLLNTIEAHAKTVINLTYDNRGKYLASTHNDINIKIWDLEQNKLDKVLQGFFPVSFSNDGRHLISSGNNLKLWIWDMVTGEKIKELDAENELVQSICFSHNGKYVAAVGYLGLIRLWDIESGKIIKKFTGHVGGVATISFSPDDKLMATGGNDATVRIWDIESGKQIQKLEDHTIVVSEVSFSPNGKKLVSGGWDSKIRIWNTETWTLEKTLEGHKNKVNSVEFNSDGTLIASAAGNSTVAEADNSIKIWNVATGEVKCTMTGHTHEITKLIYDSESDFAISGSRDASIRIWNPEKCAEVATLMAMDRDNYVIVTPDNYYTASREALRGLAFRIDNKLYPFEQFDLKLNRPDIIASRIGKSPQVLIDAYYEAYKKRLKRLGFVEEQLGNDYHVPTIDIERSGIPLVTKETNIKITAQCKDSKYKLDRILITVNGVPTFGEKGIDLKAKNLNSIDHNLSIDLMSGKNVVAISVMNDKGVESLKESFEIIREVDEEHKNLYLIEIDVSNYKDDRFNLKYPTKDAKDFREMIETTKKLYDNIYERELKDGDATVENFEKLYDFLKDVTIDDVVIVYIVGHGVLDLHLDYYYGTYDIDFNDPAVRGLSYEAIEKLLASLKSARKLLIMDTCHSGEVDKENTEISKEGNDSEENKESGKIKFRAAGAHVRTKPGIGLYNSYELMTMLFADLRNGTGATVISSAGGAEYAFEGDDWENGLFTYCLLSGIQDRKADFNYDGKIMISELKQHVYNEVVKLSDGKQKPTARKENLMVDFQIW